MGTGPMYQITNFTSFNTYFKLGYVKKRSAPQGLETEENRCENM